MMRATKTFVCLFGNISYHRQVKINGLRNAFEFYLLLPNNDFFLLSRRLTVN